MSRAESQRSAGSGAEARGPRPENSDRSGSFLETVAALLLRHGPALREGLRVAPTNNTAPYGLRGRVGRHILGSGRHATLLSVSGLLGLLLGASSACSDFEALDARKPARGPGQLVGNGPEIAGGEFTVAYDAEPIARAVELPALDDDLHCDAACSAHCEGLDLQNPVNRGICSQLWGAGIAHRPIDELQACRRMYLALVERPPSREELVTQCTAPDFAALAKSLISSDEFVDVQRRRWADILMYSHRIVNFERAFDADDLVRKTHEGRVAWDAFAAVVSAHPIFVRRYDSPEDRSDALFSIFYDRPPYAHERADLMRAYRLWYNGYWEHPFAGRVPEAYIRFDCVDGRGQPAPDLVEQCTSSLWGRYPVVLAADERAKREEGDQEGMLWSGLLSSDEWEVLQAPGRALASQVEFWEASVDRLLRHYFDYPLGNVANAVRHELVSSLLEHGGDIRSLHHAIVTSIPFLQSRRGPAELPWPWAYGPQQLMSAEAWVAGVAGALAIDAGTCDWRLPEPQSFVFGEEADGWTRTLIRESTRWQFDGEDRLQLEHAELLRSLGGCPVNESGGRFRALSILATSVQEGYVWQACGLEGGGGEVGASASIDRLLPAGVPPSGALDPTRAAAVLDHLGQVLIGRAQMSFDDPEIGTALNDAVDGCMADACTVEEFARVTCFVLLTSSEYSLN